LSFTAVETFESLSRQGAPLVYGNKFETVLQRPNKLRVLLEGDGRTSEFYYDGKIVMAYAPAENLVAVADAPSTIEMPSWLSHTSDHDRRISTLA
jgi:hypothetical protein